MLLKFHNAKYSIDSEGFSLSLYVERGEGLAFLDSMKQGKTYTAELKEYRKKRSLSANAYMWQLCDKLSDALRCTKEEVYRESVRKVGSYYSIDVRAIGGVSAVDDFIKTWSSNGIGWVCDVVGLETIFAYKGSSCYNTKEMSTLLNYIVDECHAQGIQTETPEQISNYINLWGQDEKQTNKSDDDSDES